MSKKQSTSKRGQWQVVVFNDNEHSFDEVIEILVTMCGHNTLQAHQCAVLIHNVGEYAVFEDKYDICVDVFEDLVANGLDTELRKKNVKKH